MDRKGKNTQRRYVHINIHCSKIERYFLLFYFGHQTLFDIVLQHDNARPYSARHSTQFLANNNVQNLSWPSMSPDLNPNQHTWKELGGRVNDLANVRELFQALWQEWVAIPAQVIQNLIQSMPMRC